MDTPSVVTAPPTSSAKRYTYRPPVGYVIVTSAVLFVLTTLTYSASQQGNIAFTLFLLVVLNEGQASNGLFIAALLLGLAGASRFLLLSNRFGPKNDIVLTDREITFPKFRVLFSVPDSIALADVESLVAADKGSGRELMVRTQEREVKFESLWFDSDGEFDEFLIVLSERSVLEIECAANERPSQPRRFTIRP